MVAPETSNVGTASRRDAVLDSALLTFARHGYRKTSMEEVARTARISRPGLYFLFESKETLFRAAFTRALEQDLAAAEALLAATDRPLRERLAGAFDRWAGRYAGPLGRDVTNVIEQNPDLLGEIVETAPLRFADLVTDAIAETAERASAIRITQTLISVSIGLKHQVETREAYFERFTAAVDLLVG
ncbi:TetR/AcrR family transcriptional regulator [Actinokineospora sp. PR83]|uniref:TetR/AcrR family transcriptional regulator n=1 Tax=Actinokineospora sp. PR83 TaxID=2884908 RepID=UPI001F428BDD|nr:TetR/AcrR family transcriptional regulator [Actinokineospora sp. PR83]MCG8914500.1 TetR/AcrR family transcriptional regulator [Actinokineospora sp. PR83]